MSAQYGMERTTTTAGRNQENKILAGWSRPARGATHKVKMKNGGFAILGNVDCAIRVSIGRSGQRCSRSPLGGRLATTLVATISTIIFSFSFSFFFFFSPSSMFLIEGVLGSKNLFSES